MGGRSARTPFRGALETGSAANDVPRAPNRKLAGAAATVFFTFCVTLGRFSGISFWKPASTTMKDAPRPPRGTAEGQSPRPKAVPVLSAEVLIERLWILYHHLAKLRCKHLATLAKLCRIRYETLRGWLKTPNQELCGVNEEKLARGLGGTGSAFRRAIEKTAGRADWLQCCTDAWKKTLSVFLSWLPVEAAELSLLAPLAV